MTEKAAVGEVYHTRDAKAVFEEIKKAIKEDVEQGEWLHHTERSEQPAGA